MYVLIQSLKLLLANIFKLPGQLDDCQFHTMCTVHYLSVRDANGENYYGEELYMYSRSSLKGTVLVNCWKCSLKPNFILGPYFSLTRHFLLLFPLSLSLFLTSGTDVVEKGVVAIGTNETARKDDRVEWNIILSHELI